MAQTPIKPSVKTKVSTEDRNMVCSVFFTLMVISGFFFSISLIPHMRGDLRLVYLDQEETIHRKTVQLDKRYNLNIPRAQVQYSFILTTFDNDFRIIIYELKESGWVLYAASSLSVENPKNISIYVPVTNFPLTFTLSREIPQWYYGWMAFFLGSMAIYRFTKHDLEGEGLYSPVGFKLPKKNEQEINLSE